jgi:hypothetical protein
MNWIGWVVIGFILGCYFGVALMALLQSSRRRKREALFVVLAGSPLEGASTVF